MAAENIGNVYPTKIPGYDDNADIQAALRLYHYGSSTYDVTNTDVANLPNPSLAYTLNNLQTQITNNYNSPAAAADVSDSEPSNPPNGYLWVDSDATPAGLPLSATCIFDSTQPTQNLINGLLWVKKGTSPLQMSVYDSSSNAFVRIV